MGPPSPALAERSGQAGLSNALAHSLLRNKGFKEGKYCSGECAHPVPFCEFEKLRCWCSEILMPLSLLLPARCLTDGQDDGCWLGQEAAARQIPKACGLEVETPAKVPN